MNYKRKNIENIVYLLLDAAVKHGFAICFGTIAIVCIIGAFWNHHQLFLAGGSSIIAYVCEKYK